MALTVRQIKAMQPEDKPRRYHDAGSVPGLYIEVSPSGGKWWRFRFSLNGKQRLMSLGLRFDRLFTLSSFGKLEVTTQTNKRACEEKGEYP